MLLKNLFDKLKSQGFHGHAGRPGKRGGSLPKGGSTSRHIMKKTYNLGLEAGQKAHGLPAGDRMDILDEAMESLTTPEEIDAFTEGWDEGGGED